VHLDGDPPSGSGLYQLTRVHYPQGAVSAYEYALWTGGRYLDDNTATRQVSGVGKRRMFPDGLGGTPDGLMMPHYTWLWSRQFDLSTGNCASAEAYRVSDFTATEPNGLRKVTTMRGHPCGDTTKDWGPDGAPDKTVVYDANDVAVRTIDFTPDYKVHADSGEKIENLERVIETTYHDTTDVCFESSTPAVPAPQIRHILRHRDNWNQWRMAITEGDFFRNNGWRRIEYTNYHAPDNVLQGCLTLNHIVGAFDQRFTEEGGWAPSSRMEENASFDCKGNLHSIVVKDEWLPVATVVAPDPADDVIPANQPVDGDDPLLSWTHHPSGEIATRSSGGSDDYPDGKPSRDYSSTVTWSHGQVATVQQQGLSYLTTDATIDVAGVVVSSRDANGLETAFLYDALGRPTESNPPGYVEHSTRIIYPSLNEVRTITSPGTEQDFTVADRDQIYEARFLDGLGRPTRIERSHPDETKSVQVARYDQLGRPVFVSAWMSEMELDVVTKTSWSSGDNDGDGVNDYQLYDIPLRSGSSVPWGTVTFYGVPDPGDPGNPLKAVPDPLGRVLRAVGAGGEIAERRFCGPHEEIRIHDVQTAIGGAGSEVVTRNYYDGLGRLVLVDAPSSSVDAVYSYDLRGNLTKVNLVAQLPADPFEAWRQETIADGQVRIFAYDAVGRLQSSDEPETGLRSIHGYDSGGNVLAWQDNLGRTRAYFFENTYDAAGRLTKTERVQGEPSLPATQDMERVGAAGDFEGPEDLSVVPGPGVWVEGTLGSGGTVFVPGESYWRQAPYGGCLAAPPNEPGNTGGLYFGDGCSYEGAPVGPQAVRFLVQGASRDDVLDFEFLRSVRYGTGDKDQFYILATVAAEYDSLLGAKTILYLDQQQSSYATWLRPPAIRVGDYFNTLDWPEGIARDLYLYFVFDKKGPGTTGLGVGILIDNVSVRRNARATVAEYEYDVDECVWGQNPHPCDYGDAPSNHPKGQLTSVDSYQEGRLVSKQTLIYKGLNGRLSGDEMAIDWAGVGQFQEFVSRYKYSPLGLVQEFHAPYTPNLEPTRKYVYSFNRGFLDGIRELNGVAFIADHMNPPAIQYAPTGALESIKMANGILQTHGRDDLGQLTWIDVARTGQSTETLWNTGFYDYDGTGNITGIGSQQFAYDTSGRLATAHVLPQATNPMDTSPYLTSYGYDGFGNMTGRTWSKEGDPNAPPPPGMPASHAFDSQKNQVTDRDFTYDLNGNMARGLGSTGPVSATWDAIGRMTTFSLGQPDTEMVFSKYGKDAKYFRGLGQKVWKAFVDHAAALESLA